MSRALDRSRRTLGPGPSLRRCQKKDMNFGLLMASKSLQYDSGCERFTSSCQAFVLKKMLRFPPYQAVIYCSPYALSNPLDFPFLLQREANAVHNPTPPPPCPDIREHKGSKKTPHENVHFSNVPFLFPGKKRKCMLYICFSYIANSKSNFSIPYAHETQQLDPIEMYMVFRFWLKRGDLYFFEIYRIFGQG